MARAHALEELLAVSEQAFLEEASRLVLAKNEAEMARAETEKIKESLEVANQRLAEKVRELEVFNRLAVGRELKMIELKQQINEICVKHGEKPLY